MLRIIEKPFFASNPVFVTPEGHRIPLRDMCTHPVVTTPSLYTRTAVGRGDRLSEDLEVRSSWTHTYPFVNIAGDLHNSMEYQRFLDAHHLQRGPYELLKYEVGDFFSRHIDTRLSESHLFTCLLFVPQTDRPYVGGNLIFSDEKRTFSAMVEPSKFTEPTMVIFSVNLYHEVTPIESGTRYVFKNSLVAAVPLPATIRDIDREVDDLCDGGTGFGWMDSKSGDY